MGRREQPQRESLQAESRGTSEEQANQPLDIGNMQQIAMMPPHEYKGIMQAKIAQEADKISNEIEPGGKFEVDGQWVNANGEPLKDKEKKDEE